MIVVNAFFFDFSSQFLLYLFFVTSSDNLFQFAKVVFATVDMELAYNHLLFILYLYYNFFLLQKINSYYIIIMTSLERVYLMNYIERVCLVEILYEVG